MIDYYDHDCPAFIYYTEINNIIIFNDFDIALCNASPAQSNFFETTLDRVLDILIMQDTLINDDIITLNRFIKLKKFSIKIESFLFYQSCLSLLIFKQ